MAETAPDAEQMLKRALARRRPVPSPDRRIPSSFDPILAFYNDQAMPWYERKGSSECELGQVLSFLPFPFLIKTALYVCKAFHYAILHVSLLRKDRGYSRQEYKEIFHRERGLRNSRLLRVVTTHPMFDPFLPLSHRGETYSILTYCAEFGMTDDIRRCLRADPLVPISMVPSVADFTRVRAASSAVLPPPTRTGRVSGRRPDPRLRSSTHLPKPDFDLRGPRRHHAGGPNPVTAVVPQHSPTSALRRRLMARRPAWRPLALAKSIRAAAAAGESESLALLLPVLQHAASIERSLVESSEDQSDSLSSYVDASGSQLLTDRRHLHDASDETHTTLLMEWEDGSFDSHCTWVSAARAGHATALRVLLAHYAARVDLRMRMAEELEEKKRKRRRRLLQVLGARDKPKQPSTPPSPSAATAVSAVDSLKSVRASAEALPRVVAEEEDARRRKALRLRHGASVVVGELPVATYLMEVAARSGNTAVFRVLRQYGVKMTYASLLVAAKADAAKIVAAHLQMEDTGARAGRRRRRGRTRNADAARRLMSTRQQSSLALVDASNGPLDPSTNDCEVLRLASEAGAARVVKLLLLHPKIDPSINDSECLTWAAYYGHAGVVRLLLDDRRVDPVGQHGWPLRYAVSRGHRRVAEVLLTDLRVKRRRKRDLADALVRQQSLNRKKKKTGSTLDKCPVCRRSIQQCVCQSVKLSHVVASSNESIVEERRRRNRQGRATHSTHFSASKYAPPVLTLESAGEPKMKNRKGNRGMDRTQSEPRLFGLSSENAVVEEARNERALMKDDIAVLVPSNGEESVSGPSPLAPHDASDVAVLSEAQRNAIQRKKLNSSQSVRHHSKIWDERGVVAQPAPKKRTYLTKHYTGPQRTIEIRPARREYIAQALQVDEDGDWQDVADTPTTPPPQALVSADNLELSVGSGLLMERLQRAREEAKELDLWASDLGVGKELRQHRQRMASQGVRRVGAGFPGLLSHGL